MEQWNDLIECFCIIIFKYMGKQFIRCTKHVGLYSSEWTSNEHNTIRLEMVQQKTQLNILIIDKYILA